MNHRVLSVEPAGYEDVFDMEVPEHHNFVANGVVVHNSGKSSILENLTPWPSLLTRAGPLQSHMALRDSYRDLYVTDELSGDQYRCYIQVDAETGKRDQRLFRNGEPLGEDGNAGTYLREVEQVFGQQALWIMSVMVPQQPVQLTLKTESGTEQVPSDLALASRAKRRAVLRELSGMAIYQAASLRATGDLPAGSREGRVLGAGVPSAGVRQGDARQ